MDEQSRELKTTVLGDLLGIVGQRSPTVFSLAQNYPNPLRDLAVIRYQLPKSTHTTLRIYNLAGQIVRTLVDQVEAPGYYLVRWDREDDLGRKVSAGVYFYQLKASEYTRTRKLVVVE